MKNISFLALISILFFSCEREVIIEVPQEKSKLVLNSITKAGSPITVHITKTIGVLSATNSNDSKVTNATVQLYENNQVVDTFLYDNVSERYTGRNNFAPVPGRTYKIKASATGFTGIESEMQTPTATNIKSISRRQNARKDTDGQMLDELKISFDDNAAVADFYLIKIQRPYFTGANEFTYEGIYCIRSNDKDIERKNNDDPTNFESCIEKEFLVTDKNFNGDTKEIILFVPNYDLEPLHNQSNNTYIYPVVELNSITWDQYKYNKSYDAYQQSVDNPFAEPALIYTNIKNGYGIFSAYSSDRKIIQ